MNEFFVSFALIYYSYSEKTFNLSSNHGSSKFKVIWHYSNN